MIHCGAARIWLDLGPRGEYQADDQGSISFELSNVQGLSLASWTALAEFIQQATSRESKTCQDFAFQFPVWCLEQLEPPAAFMQSINDVCQRESINISLIIQDPAKIAPDIWSTASVIRQTAPNELIKRLEHVDSQPNPFWQQAEAIQCFQTFLTTIPKWRLLWEALQQLPVQEAATDQCQWLSTLQRLMHDNQSPSGEHQFSIQADVHDKPISCLWQDLVDLQADFQTHCLHWNWPATVSPQALDVFINPVTWIYRHFEQKPYTGGVYSIGAGQMTAILDFTRQLIDIGKCPLETPLLADNRALAPIVELHQTGQRRAILNELWINPHDRKPIAVYVHDLRQALIARHQPQIIFLNVKSQVLPAIFSPAFCQFLADLPKKPILVMPSKAYTESGETPYEALYTCLYPYSRELADDLCVLGGFYAAPSILTGDLVHLTIAAANPTATQQTAQLLSRKVPEIIGATVKTQNLRIELRAGHTQAALLMAGGANKNFLTYFAARHILQQAFNADHTDHDVWLHGVDQSILHARESNISTSSAIARQLIDVQLQDEQKGQQETPAGLVADFIHCLPLNGQGICSLVEQSYRIQRHILRAPPAQRTAIAEQELNGLIEHIRRDPQRMLGTRNARDGLIDQMLDYFYQLWSQHRSRVPLSLKFASFYARFYPQAWQGDQAQEGRQGILPIIVRTSLLTDLQDTSWPPALDQTWQWYFPVRQQSWSALVLEAKQASHPRWQLFCLGLVCWAKETVDFINGRQKLVQWCQATRAQQPEQPPLMLRQLEQALASDTLELSQICQRILRDCQYLVRQ